MKPLVRLFILGCLLVAGVHADTPAPAHTRTIYLIRHGAYDMAGDGDEATAYGLTPLGLAEARLLAARLRGMPVEFDSLTSSTYTRARQTADVINQSLPQLKHETTKVLCESLPRSGQRSAVAEDATGYNRVGLAEAVVTRLPLATRHPFRIK